MPFRDKLTLSNDLACLPQVRDFIRAGVDRGDFARDYLNRLQIAVDEAVTNVIEHGYAGVAPGAASITVSLDVDRTAFRIVIEDDGVAFDPKSLPDPNVREHVQAGRSGGFGVFLMRRVMDEIEYHYEVGKRNRLVLTKRAPAAS